MRDGLGRIQSVLLIGGTSEIGLAIVAALDPGPLRRIVLAGRDPEALSGAAQALASTTSADVSTVAFEAADVPAHGAALAGAFADGDIDLVIVAIGALGDQATAEEDPQTAARLLQVNLVGAGSAALHAARLLRKQGHGDLVVLSSVAGDRPRRSNFIYGASKAGLDALSRGLAEAVRGSGARVLVVRPGFVRTRMTEGMAPAPFATDPETVARSVLAGLARGRTVVYAPGVLAPVMGVLKALPASVFRRLPG